MGFGFLHAVYVDLSMRWSDNEFNSFRLVNVVINQY